MGQKVSQHERIFLAQRNPGPLYIKFSVISACTCLDWGGRGGGRGEGGVGGQFYQVIDHFVP